jgi:asparagine synthase (glutamine-hydrolysing)
MCGIFAIFGSALSESGLRKKVVECSSRQRHRGPDWSGYHIQKTETVTHGIGHERLAIIDPDSGSQPLFSPDGNIVVAANGEIYNYKELYADLKEKYTPLTGSDCEVIIPLIQQIGIEAFPQLLRGMFSLIIYNKAEDSYCVIRDHVGITPLYMGHGSDGSHWFSSEMKSLAIDCVSYECFPPGHYYTSKTASFVPWFKPTWRADLMPKNPYNKVQLREVFTMAVKRRMMSDVPWGVLLSGGLDSSLVASVAMRMLKAEADKNNAPIPKLHSFCIGLENSPDIKAAQKVADYLGTTHHSYTYTLQEGLDAIRDVVYHLETYDTTTIRASTPMFLMSRKIKALGIKMVLSGEGADEVFAGYLYFHKAPNAEELQAELRDKIANLYLFDCLRANKSTSAWGIEPRVPFLDVDFLEVAMNIDPEEKMIKNGRIEKHIIRDAFDTPENPYLPKEILWRQKEQFSDGVGYGWIDSLRDYANEHVSDAMLRNSKHVFPDNTPSTKESYFYRQIFSEHYPQPCAVKTVPGGPSIACSTPRAIAWDASFKDRADCSGRAVSGVHSDAYDNTFEISSSSTAMPPTKKAKQ